MRTDEPSSLMNFSAAVLLRVGVGLAGLLEGRRPSRRGMPSWSASVSGQPSWSVDPVLVLGLVGALVDVVGDSRPRRGSSGCGQAVVQVRVLRGSSGSLGQASMSSGMPSPSVSLRDLAMRTRIRSRAAGDFGVRSPRSGWASRGRGPAEAVGAVAVQDARLGHHARERLVVLGRVQAGARIRPFEVSHSMGVVLLGETRCCR